MDRSTGVAAAVKLSPGCVACTTIVPAPVIVSTSPLSVPGPETTLRLTGKASDDSATRVIGLAPYVCAATELKEIV